MILLCILVLVLLVQPSQMFQNLHLLPQPLPPGLLINQDSGWNDSMRVNGWFKLGRVCAGGPVGVQGARARIGGGEEISWRCEFWRIAAGVRVRCGPDSTVAPISTKGERSTWSLLAGLVLFRHRVNSLHMNSAHPRLQNLPQSHLLSRVSKQCC